DTGRLPEETYRLMQQTKERYGLEISVYFPKSDDLEIFARKNGPNGFYDSIEIRKSCCHIRKVEPLKRALIGRNAWITGMRRQQSPTRSDLREVEYDEENGLYKYNPLLEWSEKEIWSYARMRNVPYNELHDKGFPSIGCSPCTRAVAKGEDIRAGRWWWEDSSNRECGLHRKKA
ncbi:MAG TPA: phosphoadenylyl-sulfate reductase, partial [Burkholderiales bacterium]|nr:phosphoadenylyl-sulfate reductase [Burkholderiales bacterium]